MKCGAYFIGAELISLGRSLFLWGEICGLKKGDIIHDSSFDPSITRLFFWKDEQLANLQQPVGDLDSEILIQVVGEIPWDYNIQLRSKVKDPLQRNRSKE